MEGLQTFVLIRNGVVTGWVSCHKKEIGKYKTPDELYFPTEQLWQ